MVIGHHPAFWDMDMGFVPIINVAIQDTGLDIGLT